MAIMPSDPGPAGVFGEDHYYSVIFRGNGDAVVNLKAIFTNTEEATVSAITLRVPKGQPQDIVAYQIFKEPRCIRYEPTKIVPSTGIIEDRYDPPVCIEYDNPDYYGYYYSNDTKYKKAQVESTGDTIVITLPEGVPAESSASYILYYRAKEYTQKDFAGAYSYTFETLKTESPIRNVQIGISTDTDLKLKNASSTVNYGVEDSVMSDLKAAPTLSSAGMTNQAFERYYQQIGQGTIVETASSLQPLDTFTVDGAYAKSSWQLYAKTLLIGIVVTLVVLALIGFGLFKLFRHVKKKAVPATSGTTHGSIYTVLWMLGGSFGSSLVTAIYTIFLFIVMNFVNGNYYFGYQYNLLVVLFILILSLGVYPLCLFIPSIVMGMRKGLWWGVGTFALTIAWLMIYLFIIFGFLFMTQMNDSYPRPLPYVYGTSDRISPETVQTELK